MSATIDLQSVFHCVKSLGFQHSEVYIETDYATKILWRDKICAAHHSQLGGSSIRCFGGRPETFLTTTQTTTQGILALLEGSKELSVPPSQPTVINESQKQTRMLIDKLSPWLRKTLGAQSSVSSLYLEIEFHQKRFYTFHSNGQTAEGMEHNSRGTFHWTLKQNNKKYVENFYRLHVTDLLQELLEERGLEHCVQRSVHQSKTWPTPNGDIPVLWSHRALAKVIFPFVRSFEGDLVLKKDSLLNRASTPIPLRFSLYDSPLDKSKQFDQEGYPQKPLTLFSRGTARNLICNQEIGKRLELPSTGHCRRQSFRSYPTVAIRNALVLGQEESSDVLPIISNGIMVDDLEILSFVPKLDRAKLLLRGCRLIHQGEIGEYVDDCTLSTSMIDLLSSLSHFSDKRITTGIPIRKSDQALIAEITTPCAISSPLPIRGTVPRNHYW